MTGRRFPDQPADPTADQGTDQETDQGADQGTDRGTDRATDRATELAPPSPGGEGALDAPRLVRLVRRRRRLRRTLLLTLLGVPVVTTAAAIADSVANWDYDQHTRDLVDLAAFAVVTAITAAFLLSAGWLAPARLRRRRPEDVFAAHIRPVFRRGGQVEARGDRTHAAALVGVLDHRPRFGAGVLIWFLGSVAFATVIAFQVGPVWNANHGHGGTRITIGQNAGVDHTEHGRHGTNYYLATPDGVTISQSGAVHDGERMVVIGSGAYAVGGHTYLLLGALLAAGLASTTVTGLMLAGTWHRETRRRGALGTRHPGEALELARSGGRISLAVLADRPGRGRPSTPIAFGTLDATLLTGPQWVARGRRRTALIAAVPVIAAALAVTALVAGAAHLPVSQRPVTIPGLPASLGHPKTTAQYEGDLVDPALFGDVVGSRPATMWVVSVYDLPDDAYAGLDVYRTASPAAAAGAAAKWTAYLTQPDAVENPRPLPAGVLPAGWSGTLTGSTVHEARFVTAAGPYVVEGIVAGGLQTTDAQLTGVTHGLLSAISSHGVAAFAESTAN